MRPLIACSILLLAIISVTCTTNTASANELDRPNILWLSIEDIGPQIGCYGFDIETPALDQLAKRSLVFDVAWSNYPVCAPARTTIISGMYASALGAGNMRSAAKRKPNVRLLPELLQEAGYYCTNAFKTDYNFADLKQTSIWNESSRKAHWKNRSEGQPFFAVFNNTNTHESKVRTRPHTQQIDPDSLALPPYWPDTPEVREDFGQYLDNIQTMDSWIADHLKSIDEAGLTDDTIVIFFGDHGAGLPRHKRFAGDSGMRVPFIVHVPKKWQAFWSAEYGPGKRTDAPVGFIDLAPSMLNVAGIDIPARFQGNSFLGPDTKRAKYVFGVRNRMDERYDVSRSLRDEQFVYIHNFMPHLPHGQFIDYQQTTNATRVWYEQFKAGTLNDVQSAFWQPRSREELYDLKNDPHETVNLAGDPEHSETVAKMRSAMIAKMLEIQDVDLVPESILHEFEIASGEPRTAYADKESFSFDKLISVAMQENSELDLLDSAQPEIRFWTLVGLINDPETSKSNAARLKKMLGDPSMAVQIKAAEALLASEAEIEAAVERLLKLADIKNSNYYVAANALDCLDRYRQQLKPETILMISTLPTKPSDIQRGNDNLEKLLRRFQ